MAAIVGGAAGFRGGWSWSGDIPQVPSIMAPIDPHIGQPSLVQGLTIGTYAARHGLQDCPVDVRNFQRGEQLHGRWLIRPGGLYRSRFDESRKVSP